MSAILTAKVIGEHGTTLHVYSDETRAQVEQMIEKALRAGARRVDPDGTETFIAERTIFDPTQSGSDAYVWNASGSKVKARLTRVVRRAGKIMSETPVGTRWVTF